MGLLILVSILINVTSVQNFLVGQVTKTLSQRLKTKVSIDHIRLDLLNHVLIQGVYVETQQQDTLLYAGEIRLRITDWFVFRDGVPVIKYIGLHNTYANLNRPANSADWNYQFIIDAFGKADTTQKTESSGGNFNIDLKEVDLTNIRFNMNDAWVGSDMNFEVGDFKINADKIDLEKRIIKIDEIAAISTKVIMRDYDGGRPPKPKKPKTNIIDTTPFNTDKWAISLNDLNLKDCYFSLDNGTGPALVNEFDPDHMHVSGINVAIEDFLIDGDTITATMHNLAAKERCGLIVKKMQAEVRISPNETICKNLLLQTNNSELHDYYAMHYKRFPDFLDYINKVVMVAHFDKAKIDSKDIAYFATVLRQYPTTLNISGNIKGTVAAIQAKNLYLNDGYNTVKGDITMDGLPDIATTYIDYRNGELFTSAKGLLKYAPDIKDNKTVNINGISHAYFKGNFKGYINNFILNGTIVSNIGTIVSDVKMKIPEEKNATTTYSGKVSVNELNLGMLLMQPDLGTVTLKADVDGSESKAEGASVNFNTIIEHIEYRKYAYQGINADGKLEKGKFTGNLLINDPNISLGFYGLFDFSSDRLKINAKANLLQSNLNALNLISGDNVHLLADFDLDWEGNNIDDFTGYAKIYNIDLQRNGHRLDLDSIYINATETGTDKLLTVESNALKAQMQGRYQLSTLANSFQYYISGYLPNYIKAPDGAAPDQDISFTVTTHDLDSLFGVFIPSVSGFNNTQVDGYLNTTQQQLKLNANIPYGMVNGISVNNTSIAANGTFTTLSLNVDVGKVILTDTALNGTMKLNTTLGSDKLSFDITTKSPNALGEAVIKGEAIAHGDTMDLSLLPSEFYLQESKWVIPAGNKVVFTDGYLAVNNFNIQSGEQKINIQSSNNGLKQLITTTISNLKASAISNLAGMSDYNIQANINGDILVEDLFTNMIVRSNIKATNVMFDKDTVGNINVSGNYDSKRNLLTLDETTGIYRNDKSLTASGKLSFDSTISQNIDAQINLNHTPLTWISPILHGFVSDIKGTLDGRITIRGTSESPDIAGRVNLADIGMHVDFLGTNYTIPEAAIVINDKEISLGKMSIKDRFDNTALLTGGIDHNRFNKMKLNLKVTSSKFEVIDLKSSESDVFYGNMIAKFESLTVTGPFNNVSVRINKAQPAQKSHLYLPLSSGDGSELGAYSYITFKNYGDTIEKRKIEENKLSIYIDAILNPLGEITMVMDPSTGDAINAKGTGNISIEIPPNNDIRMYGKYEIEDGSYTFTLPQLFFKRKFILNQGSIIQFGGTIDNTQLNVDGIYKTRARLYDLLSNQEKDLIVDLGEREETQAKMTREIDVILEMKGSLGAPELGFNIELPDKSGAGTIAYKKLEAVNNDERKLFNQVASLLLVNTFIPEEGGGFESGASAGVVSNVGDIFSGTASSQLTNLIGRLTGDDDIAIDLKYQQYSFNNNDGQTAGNRNAVSLGVKKNLFKDRLTVEVGSSVDWGKPTSTNSSSNFNPVGDFRLQYLIKEGGNLRGNIFRTSSYDVLADQNITRGGIGLTWRKSFDNLTEFFRGSAYLRKQEEIKLQRLQQADSTNAGGTN